MIKDKRVVYAIYVVVFALNYNRNNKRRCHEGIFFRWWMISGTAATALSAHCVLAIRRPPAHRTFHDSAFAYTRQSSGQVSNGLECDNNKNDESLNALK